MTNFTGTTEIITLEKPIKILGLSLAASSLPLNVDSLGLLWDLYAENCRLDTPATEYGICINDSPDYIVGTAAPAEPMGANAQFVLPAGRYIKDTFSADSFEKLVGETIFSRDVKAWAAANNVKINGDFDVEVYERARFELNDFTMYTLTPLE